MPAPVSFTFTAAITFLVAAVGTFAFARELGCREGSAAVAAAAYTSSSAITLFVLWPLGLAWALLPFVLLGTQRVATEASLHEMGAYGDFRQKAWIAANVVPYERRNGPGEATIRRVGNNRYPVRAQMQQDGWVVISNTNWNGWRAYVDGRPAPIDRANVAFQGVHLTAGQHEVRLVYLPRSFVVGRSITIASILAISSFLLLRRRADQTAGRLISRLRGRG